MNHCCRIVGNKIHIAIKAIPGASKTEFAGVKEGCLRVRIAAAPEDGKANAALIAFFAKAIGCPRRELTLLCGEKSRNKILALPLVYREQLESILRSCMGDIAVGGGTVV
ncbi:MAG: DUF167 domain-containing protein [Treponema sp.]|nr:DUF167 domain-containing protein [Treponema sp.]